MNLIMISPEEKKSMNIAWIEVNTPVGNFVIQRGHIPTVLLLSPHQPVTICLTNGKQESFTVPGGILEVTRKEALLLLNT